ncbi:prepilin peptidase [bacterium]|nr:prepilin peptidase [bacterium]
METIIAIIGFGLVWGSFLNVVIYRLPRRKSLIKPASSCPQCGQKIKPYDNIPIFSYLLLKGKCRSCGAKIPFSYPLVEILTPLCFVLLFLYYGGKVHFFTSCLFASLLIVLGFIDYFHQVLPDELTLPGLGLALVYSLVREDLGFTQSLLGAAVGAGFLFLVYGSYYLLRKKEGMGMGDVTMMLLVGAYLGWKMAFFTLILASFVGALVGLLLILFKRKNFQYSLPFGTFLAPAAFVALLWGERIIHAYLSLYKSP